MSDAEGGSKLDRRHIGRYQLLKKIAVGGMAEIYLARVEGVGGFKKNVVLKRILPQLAESKEFFRMFLDEARIAATLAHPNVVQVYDAGHDAGEYYIAMEYLDGADVVSIRRHVDDKEELIPLPHALNIVTSVCAGLHYAHTKKGLDDQPLNIVHRDVTPHNIFVTVNGNVKLVDFGIAKASNRLAKTGYGTLKGKLAYLSPEQCRGDEVDARSDVYSVGIVLYELTTGERLYKGLSEYNLLKEIVEGEVDRPSSYMDYDPELEAILMKALAKDRDQRYQSARELQQDLENYVRGKKIPSSTLELSAWVEPIVAEVRAAAKARANVRVTNDPYEDTGGIPSGEAAGGDSDGYASYESSSRRKPRPESEAFGTPGLDNLLAELRTTDTPAPPATGREARPTMPAQPSSMRDADVRAGTDASDEEIADRALAAALASDSEPEAPAANRPGPDQKLFTPPHDISIEPGVNLVTNVRRGQGAAALIGLIAVAAVGGGGYLVYKAVTSNEATVAAQDAGKAAPEVPAVGRAVFDASPADAAVWIKVGRTPATTVPVDSAIPHVLRVEHEGYRSADVIVSPDNWKERDSHSVEVKLAEKRDKPLPALPDAVKERDTGTNAMGTISITSIPEAANVWLFVGTADALELGGLPTDKPHAFRIAHKGYKPAYVTITNENFTYEGVAEVKVNLTKNR